MLRHGMKRLRKRHALVDTVQQQACLPFSLKVVGLHPIHKLLCQLNSSMLNVLLQIRIRYPIITYFLVWMQIFQNNKIFDRWIIAITFLLKFAPRRTDWSVGLKILSLVTMLLLTKGIASAHEHVQHKRTFESFF